MNEDIVAIAVVVLLMVTFYGIIIFILTWAISTVLSIFGFKITFWQALACVILLLFILGWFPRIKARW